MANKYRGVDVKESVALQHRIAIGLTALTLGAASLGLSVALLVTPNGVVNNLFAPNQGAQPIQAASTATAITLTWTAPGDDGSVGRATSYDLRRSTSTITPLNFDLATRVTGLTAPLPAGSTESYTVNGLSPDTTYHFAIKSADEAGNISPISNVVVQKTAAIACVPSWQCTDFTACSADGVQTRTCTDRNSCGSSLGRPIEMQACTPPPPPPVGGIDQGVSNSMILAGLGSGTYPKVRILEPDTYALRKEFIAFRTTNRYGTHVDAGDLDNDGIAEVIVGTGPGSQAAFRVFRDDGTKLATIYPFGIKSYAGVTIAVADVNGDGRDEIVAGAASRSAAVRVFSFDMLTNQATEIAAIPKLSATYRSGYNVAAGDLDLDGRAEIIIGRRANGSGYRVFSYNDTPTLVQDMSLVAYPRTFASGVQVATGDINGDGRGDVLVVPGRGYYSSVRAYTDSGDLIGFFKPFSTSFYGGAVLTTYDVNDDGVDEILASPFSRAQPILRTFRYDTMNHTFVQIGSQNVYPATIRNGLRLGGI